VTNTLTVATPPPLAAKPNSRVNWTAAERAEWLTMFDKGGQSVSEFCRTNDLNINIDQNPIERRFRPTNVGLHDYFFIGHPAAGWHSAVVYSEFGSCKLLGVNPEAYNRWALLRLAAATNRTAPRTISCRTTLRGCMASRVAYLMPNNFSCAVITVTPGARSALD
jgi:hypothetical protein